jgi:Flp pilus assembly protein TadG
MLKLLFLRANEVLKQFWLRSLRPMARSEHGVSAVEFALGGTMIMGLLSPVIDLGLAFQQQDEIQLAAQAGAQYALHNGWNSSGVSGAVTSATSLSGVSASPAPSEGCGCPSGTAITSAVCGSTCNDGEKAGTYVTVNAQAPYTPVVPFSLLGSGTTLSAQAIVRIQ